MYTVYFLGKFYFFIESSIAHIMSKFIVETLNRLLNFKEKHKILNQKQENIVKLCEHNLLLIDNDKFKSYKYLFSESFKKLLAK